MSENLCDALEHETWCSAEDPCAYTAFDPRRPSGMVIRYRDGQEPEILGSVFPGSQSLGKREQLKEEIRDQLFYEHEPKDLP